MPASSACPTPASRPSWPRSAPRGRRSPTTRSRPSIRSSAWSRSTSREFVLADIPGLIEGAHEGAGLGDRFLGHVERCRVLLHLVDGTGEHAGKAYKTVRAEIEAYGSGLADKPRDRRAQQGGRDVARRDQTASRAPQARRGNRSPSSSRRRPAPACPRRCARCSPASMALPARPTWPHTIRPGSRKA